MTGKNGTGIYPGKRGLRYRFAKHPQLLLFMLIPIVWLILFKYVPMVGAQIAFRRYSIKGGLWGSDWVGLDNFVKFFTSYQFARVLPNTIKLSIYALIAGFPIPIILALSLNAVRSARYRKLVQTVIYLPHFISVVVLVGMIMAIFNPRIGLYGIFGEKLTGQYPIDLFAKANSFPHMYVWSGVWQNMGWSTIIYTAALSSVDMELHEAAQIDGASRFARVIHIDLWVILPTATIMLILSSGSIMSVGFEKVYLMQNKLNLSTSEVISTYVYKVGMTAGNSDYSYSTAIGMFNSLVNMLMLCLVNFIAGRLSATSLW